MSEKSISIDAGEFLDRFVNLEKSLDPDFPRTLERMSALLDACGRPVRSGYRIITVAGSKGKGSTASMIASILRRQGLKTGLYTSPHLECWTERIAVDGAPISVAEASAIAGWLDERLQGARLPHGLPTYFEIMTVMALEHFARSRCDVCVLEVGLGGEFDATNVCDADVAVITPIGHEHERVLGSTIREIARAKCGIIKPGVPVVAAPQKREAMDVIEETCLERGATLHRVGEQALVEPLAVSEVSQSFLIGGLEGKQGPFELPLVGEHQAENAAAAWLAVRLLGQKTGRMPDARMVADGFRTVRWPGRMELASAEPRIVLDGAHTPESAQALMDAIRRHFRFTRFDMVLGMMADKNPEGFLEPFRGTVGMVHVVPLASGRSFEVAELTRRVQAAGFRAERHDFVESAIGEARAAAGPFGHGTLILVTGSLYLVGHARRILKCAP